ncbi:MULTISPECIES: M56 family metallopeptidase [unclassified Cryobacterium]|uniref:M56 family metallopeptidase n=1 Tax=unclassified Cryobacterium TaxID=2649013 RepID=UPI002AB3E6B1|nr:MULTISPECIES: M56 family metallopeptidase [unclassified Cryobacterium]MDY7528249.1 M56 family metallopeptidase [Cryobacterium sp. 10C2]MDY7556005.1 M56 family metallopeptidase [Cryobacterium sp. 10C3]MEB0289252.1 M56 family metallopeptidase [Cryobacterium sp. 10C2]
MIVAIILTVYAIALSLAVPQLLLRANWVDRAPRLAIASWQALTVAVVGSLALAGLSFAIPIAGLGGQGIIDDLQACAMALQQQYSTPAGAAVGIGGALLAGAVITRSFWGLASTGARMSRERNAHRRVLDMVGRPDFDRDIVILDSTEAAVYCMPGIHRRTVVTTAALHALTDEELIAVLAHERAHLTERHDLALAFSVALSQAFHGLPPFRLAARETSRLVELRADDVAAARTHRLTVAAALLAVVAVPPHAVPAVALGATGTGAAARVRRLLPPRQSLGRVPACVAAAAIALLLVAPGLALGWPAVTSADHALCPAEPETSLSASLSSSGSAPAPAPAAHAPCAVDSMDEGRFSS